MIARRYRIERVSNEEIPFIFAGKMRPKAPLRMRLYQR
jgi:hypothetical protein